MVDDGAGPRGDRPHRWRAATAAAAAMVVMVLCVCAGWAVAHRFESPEQRQAAAKPPAPNEVVVTVRSGVLQEQTTALADVGDAATTTVQVPGGSGLSVVTAAPLAVGSSVSGGTVVLEVNGRPVFALPGSFPFY